MRCSAGMRFAPSFSLAIKSWGAAGAIFNDHYASFNVSSGPKREIDWPIVRNRVTKAVAVSLVELLGARCWFRLEPEGQSATRQTTGSSQELENDDRFHLRAS